MNSEKREKLAEICHAQWSGWMEYLFSKSIHYEPEKAQNLEGTVIIPKWAVERWKRQINTPYAELTENEKENDRAEADRILDVLSEETNNTISIENWFDVNDMSHLKAFTQFQRTGTWPEGFIPNYVTFSKKWEFNIMTRVCGYLYKKTFKEVKENEQ